MAKNSIYDYSTTASNNTDIAGMGILGTNAVSNFDDAFRTIMAQIATDVSPRRMAIQGALYGLTLSNNAGDATNDIDIAVGMATTDSTSDPRTMVLASALTKRLDATWVVGTNQGGLDTGSIANAWYYIWLIQRSDTGVVDALFSLSATSPTMPSNYDRKRRIGAILRASASIQAFFHNEDHFEWATQPIDVTVTNPGTAGVNRTVSVPPNMYGDFFFTFTNTSTTTVSNFYLYRADLAALPGTIGIGLTAAGRQAVTPGRTQAKTNSSSQVRTAVSSSDANVSFLIGTIGWVDTRGRIA